MKNNKVWIFIGALALAYFLYRKYSITIDLGIRSYADLTRSSDATVLPAITISDKKTGEVVASTKKPVDAEAGKSGNSGAKSDTPSAPKQEAPAKNKPVVFRMRNLSNQEKAVQISMYNGYRMGGVDFIPAKKTVHTIISPGNYSISVSDVMGTKGNPIIRNTIYYNHIIDGKNDFLIYI